MTENYADLVLHNGRVSAATVRDGRVAATRAHREVTRCRGQRTSVVDLTRSGAAASSGDLFQKVTSHLAAVFEARGCALPVADELAQRVTGEFKARVREVLRRLVLDAKWISGVIQVGELTLDLERHIFWRGDDEVHLSPKEFDVIAFMMKDADVLLPHVKLLRSVWGPEYGGELEYLRTIIYALRRKIEKNPANPEYIVSEPGTGYRFRNPASVAPRLAQPHCLVPPPAVPIRELGGAR
jgi:DNA-binding winged helix-turn-helix (wHTH) protein